MSVAVVFQAISIPTIVASLVSGFLLGLILLRVDPFANTANCLIHAALPGTAFLGMVMAARYSQGIPKWEFYIGVLLLWALYISAAMAAVVLWRWYRGRKV
jgi:hypothetical protein